MGAANKLEKLASKGNVLIKRRFDVQSNKIRLRVISSHSKNNKPSGRRRSQEERRAKTTGKLLKATINLLLERGYSRFRIADAAAKAKVSRGSQAHHYATKNELVEAAIEQLFEDEVSQAQIDAANTSDSEIIQHAAQHADAFLSSKLYQVSLNMLISVGESEHLADGVRAISARSRAPIEEAWINRIVQSGVSREEAKAILGVLWSVQRSIVVEGRIGSEFSAKSESGNELDFAIDLLDAYLEKKTQQDLVKS